MGCKFGQSEIGRGGVPLHAALDYWSVGGDVRWEEEGRGEDVHPDSEQLGYGSYNRHGKSSAMVKRTARVMRVGSMLCSFPAFVVRGCCSRVYRRGTCDCLVQSTATGQETIPSGLAYSATSKYIQR